MPTVPVIDLRDTAVINGEAQALAALDSACRDHGFFLITGHGLDGIIERMWAQATEFFLSPRSDRLAILRTAEKPLGYYDRELTKQKRDLKEVFDFTRPSADDKNRNQWPQHRPAFRHGMDAYYEAMSELAEQVLALLQQALGVNDSPGLRGDANTSNVRLNNYPLEDPLSGQERGEVNALGNMALHHHTDPGLVTLLVQDATGGLQTLSTEKGWIDVAPLSGAIIVNLGDVLQAWSNDQYRAAVHRVVPMTGLPRMSTPYFYNPPADAIIEPHPLLAAGAPKYRPFAWREFIQSRIDDNFTDLEEEDAQVSKYRIAD